MRKAILSCKMILVLTLSAALNPACAQTLLIKNAIRINYRHFSEPDTGLLEH